MGILILPTVVKAADLQIDGIGKHTYVSQPRFKSPSCLLVSFIA